LANARGLTQGQLFGSIGNLLTVLPADLERPLTWREVGNETREEPRKAPAPQIARSRRLMSWL
jgi:hypothetical protein